MKSLYIVAFTILSVGGTLVSCSKSSSSNSSASPLLTLSTSTTVGNSILIDSSGRAVYNFIFDAQGKATCLNGCAVVWPHEYFKNLSQKDLGAGLNISDFSTVTNSDGGSQTTYKGHPLYIYTGDTKTNGVWSVTGNNIEGGVWFVGQPAFTVFISDFKLINGKDSAYLTTPDGMTLYSTTATADASLTAYKPASTVINVPARLSDTDFSINGSGQLTYKGTILYTSRNDANRGDINGASVSNTSLVLLP